MPRASLRNASQKGGKELFTSYLKVSRIEEMLEAPRAGGPVSVRLQTLLPLTLPHEGRAFCLNYFFPFSL